MSRRGRAGTSHLHSWLMARRRDVNVGMHVLILALLLVSSACTSHGRSVRAERITDDATSTYLRGIEAKVQRRWSPPCLPPTMPGGADRATTPPVAPSGSVTLDILVAKDGDVSDIRTVRSSGYDSIDTAAVDVVRAVAPFPRVPNSVSGEGITVRTTLGFGDDASAPCRPERVSELPSLTPDQHARAQDLLGRWGRDCALQILEVTADGRVRTKAIDGTEIVGRYEPRNRFGVVGAVSWRWPAAVARWEYPVTWLGVGGDWITYLYRPTTPFLYVETTPHTKGGASYPDPSGDRLYRCER